MELESAIFGACAAQIARAAGVPAQTLHDPLRLCGRVWRVLVLTRDGAEVAGSCGGAVDCDTLVLPADCAVPPQLRAAQVIDCGLSLRDTLTVSSMEQGLLCLQRRIVTLSGALLEPQELAGWDVLAALGAEPTLLAAGLRLLYAETV